MRRMGHSRGLYVWKSWGGWGVFDHSYTCLRIEDRGRGAGEHSGRIDHISTFLRIEYSVWGDVLSAYFSVAPFLRTEETGGYWGAYLPIAPFLHIKKRQGGIC